MLFRSNGTLGEIVLKNFCDMIATCKTREGLAKMVEKEPATSRVLEKLNSAMTVGAPQYEKAKERTGRATGGKVGRKTTAETLIAMANRARKKIQNDTKPILEEPDEIVVSALKVANKHI